MSDPTAPLPPGAFDAAMSRFRDLQEQRVRRRYNRARGVFAEFVVATLVGGEVIEDPAAAWDVAWPVGDRTVRLEVKCSGEYLPRRDDHRVSAKWSFPEPASGWHPGQLEKLPRGRHCDALVLARHVGHDIEAGWTFWVLPVDRIGAKTRGVTEHQLEAWGARRCEPEDLEITLRTVVAP